MIEFEKFKKSLGKKAELLSDEEIQKRRIQADRLADAFFTWWSKKENRMKAPEQPLKVYQENVKIEIL